MGRLKVIGPDHPQYLEKFQKAFGSGMSITSRQAARCAKAADHPPVEQTETHVPQPKPDSFRPSGGSQENHPLANRESKED